MKCTKDISEFSGPSKQISSPLPPKFHKLMLALYIASYIYQRNVIFKISQIDSCKFYFTTTDYWGLSKNYNIKFFIYANCCV